MSAWQEKSRGGLCLPSHDVGSRYTVPEKPEAVPFRSAAVPACMACGPRMHANGSERTKDPKRWQRCVVTLGERRTAAPCCVRTATWNGTGDDGTYRQTRQRDALYCTVRAVPVRITNRRPLPHADSG